MSETWQGWHFLPADGKLKYGDGREPQDGEEVSATGDIVLCERGMHASADILDCLQYAPGPILCRVELRGERLDEGDKSVARTRVILWRIDATDVLRRFAFWCADRAVRVHAVAALRRDGSPDAVRHADLLATLPEIVDTATANAASAAARAAARAAAWDAARAAAWDAAWDAARAAARAAAWAAAMDAARAAAWDAARNKFSLLVAEAFNND